MVRRFILLLVVVCMSVSARADQMMASRARNLMNDLLRLSTDLAKEAQRDGEVLRLLREAARNLDDWQKNAAVSKALDNIHKAEQLAGQPPLNQRVRQAARIAKEIVEPARDSPSSADLPKLRAELHARPIEQMRDVVAEDIQILASLTTQAADVNSVLARGVAGASGTVVGRGE